VAYVLHKRKIIIKIWFILLSKYLNRIFWNTIFSFFKDLEMNKLLKTHSIKKGSFKAYLRLARSPWSIFGYYKNNNMDCFFPIFWRAQNLINIFWYRTESQEFNWIVASDKMQSVSWTARSCEKLSVFLS
jgi:hypothetical protein